jgi:hypothetical protein
MRWHGLRRNAYIFALCIIVSGEAKADEEGCTVLLCLSNPAGWAAVQECIPPVQRALKAMAKGRMPQCTFRGAVAGSDARIVFVTEPTTSRAEDGQPVALVRALEFRDATGTIRRIKF